MLLKTNFSEKKLVDRCLNNDRLAQKELYDKYRCAMYSTAVRLLNNNFDDASDVLQEAFIEIFRDLASFKYISTLGAWIKTIVVRKALLKLRSNKSFEPITPEALNQTIEWRDCFTAEYLGKAIQGLPEGTRTIFLLVAVEGLKHKEVAEMLNISEGTSKSQLNYAKVLLKQKLMDFKND
jgi:RNA polymerase sigma factor (sigma-70 family)